MFQRFEELSKLYIVWTEYSGGKRRGYGTTKDSQSIQFENTEQLGKPV